MCWLGSTDRVEIEPNKDLRVVDRAFLHGDVVARAADALGAQGVVSAVHLDLDLRFADGSLVRDVNARRVAHVREFRPGHYVTYGDWVGKIVEVNEDVVVRFDDGAECVVLNADEEELVPNERSTLFADEEHCPYFPGAVVHATRPGVWRDALWTRGSSKEAPKRETSGGGGRDDAEAADAPAVAGGSATATATASTSTPTPRRPYHKKSLSARVSAMRARTKGVVFAVRASEVTVRWLACARRAESDAYDYSVAGAFPRAPRTPGPESEGGAAAPPEQMPASALRPLTHFAHTCFQLGDRTVVPETPPPKSHSSRRRMSDETSAAVAGDSEILSASDPDGYDSDFPDVSSSSNDRYEGGGVDGDGIVRSHKTASAGAGVAASVCESVGVALDVNRGLRRLFKNVEKSNGAPFDPVANKPIPLLRPAATVVGTHTYVDVRWQDGSVTRHVAAKDLVPQLHLGEHDFWPGQFVARRADDRNPPLANGGVAASGGAGVADIAAALGGPQTVNAVPEPRHGHTFSGDDVVGSVVGMNAESPAATLSPFGVVETVDQLERVATVRWLPPDSAFPDASFNTMRWVAAEERWVDFGPEAASREDDRERVSVYEIREDDEYGFRLGDIVVAPSRFDAELERRVRIGAPRECMLARSERDLLDLESDDEKDDESSSDDEDDEVARGGNTPRASSDDEDDESSSSEYEEADDATTVEPNTSGSTNREQAQPGEAPAPGEDRTSRSVREKPLVPPDADSLTWVGEVIGASDGVIRVAWGDGSISNCHPKFAWVVSHDDDDDDSVGSLLSGSDFDSGDESDASWETLGADDRADDPASDQTNGESGLASRSNPEQQRAPIDSYEQSARRGVPEPPPGLGLGSFDGAAALDPVARAYVERRREEAEFGWLAEHVRRAGGSSSSPREPPSSSPDVANVAERNVAERDVERNVERDFESNAPAASASAAERPPRTSNSLTPEEAARAAAALAAAFSGLRGVSAAETLPPTSETSPESTPLPDSSKETHSSSKEEHSERNDDSEKKEEDAFAAFASVQSSPDVAHTSAGSGSSAPTEGISTDAHVDELLLADHRFKAPASPPDNLVAWSKAVRREWRTLASSLPANVWVRVFEARTDLMRAAMLGPEGTPYHDNVFVFDFSLGPRYPDEPPSASYHSRGERVNPNLYENGKVCLSLLATWAGKGTEVWDPRVSNMLQVLVSIQGLVLVDDPYYNEAGYEKQSGTEEGKRNGDQYNEQAFLASVRSMIATLRDPPMHFEQLIRAHFKKRSVKILEACFAYLNEGCPIGQHEKWRAEKKNAGTGDASGASASAVGSPDEKQKKGPSRPPPTEGFKLTLRKLMPRLEAAFKANDETVDASGA